MPGQDAAVPLTLPEMLQKLARERAGGVLKVEGAEGWKVLEIQSGALRLVTGTEGKRLRIGDILVARGKITRKDVQRSLETQKRTGEPLGEALANRGLISRSEIQDIVRFQIEEEIYELFTWKGAECTFEENATLGAQMDAYPDATKLTIDPQRILTEAARRIPTWQRIENVIYSPHMSLRLTERGEAMLKTATRGGRKLLELIRDGYSVEFIVRKAMVGRFAIWKALGDLMEAQAAASVPDNELDGLARGWEQEGKLEQALGAHLRLAEVTVDRIKNGEYRGKIRVLRERIAALEGEEQEGAPKRVRRRRRSIRKPAFAALTVLVIMATTAYIAFKATSKHSAKDYGPYRQALKEASDLERQYKLAEAREVWDQFLARYPEGGGAELARSQRERLDGQYERLVEIELTNAQKLMLENRFAEAIALYKDVLVQYPLTKKRTRIATLRTQAETDAAKFRQNLDHRQVTETLERARKLLEEKRYGEANSLLETVVGSGKAGHQLRNEGRKLLDVVGEAEKKAEALIRKGRALEQQRKLDEALKIYKECFDLWARSRPGRTAADKLTELGQDRARAQRLYERALRRYADGDFTGAVGNLKRAARYKGWRVAELAEKKIEDLAGANERSAKLLERASALEAQGLREEAFKTLVELSERYPHTLAAKKTSVEVRIESVPAGALTRFNRKRIGSTPLTIRMSPKGSGTIVLTKPGFATLEERFGKVSPVMLFHLQREVLFRKPLGRPIRAGPVAAGDRMVVRSGELLTLFLVVNGAPIWQSEVGPPANPRAKPCVTEETVFAGAGAAPPDKPRIQAFYLSNGLPRAEYPLPSPAVTTPMPVRLKLLAGRLFVIAGCSNGEVVSYDIMVRRKHWSARVKPPIRFDPVVTQAAVVVPSPGGNVVAFDVLDGHQRWTEDLPGEVAGDLAADDGGEYVAALTSLGELYLFSAGEGGKIARILIEGVHGGGVALISGEEGGRAYVGGDDGSVRCVEVRTGSEVWKRKVGGGPDPARIRDAPVVHGGMVYVCTESGADSGLVIAFDAETGDEQWRLEAGSPVTASALARGDRLVICTTGGEVIGLEVDTGPAGGR